MKNSTKTLMLLAMLSIASVMYANSVNCSATPGNAACAPSLSITYRQLTGSIQNVSSGAAVFSGGAWIVNVPAQTLPGIQVSAGTLVTGSDPFVGFSQGFTNITNAAELITMTYMTPYAGGPYGFAQTILGDPMIDLGKAVSSMTPVGSAFLMNTYDTGTLIGALGIGKGFSTNTFGTSPDAGTIGPIKYTSNAAGDLTIKISFLLSADSFIDVLGYSALTPVPEPGTLVLLGSGLIGLAGLARRRMSR